MRLFLGVVTVVGMMEIGSINAQQAARPTFQVASVRPNPSGEGSSRSAIEPSGRVTVNNITLKNLIEQAYGVGEYQISGPVWLDTERYDIVAQAYPGVTQEQVLLMGQVLIEDRFHFEFHRETRELSVYRLVAAKNGPKLQPGNPSSRFLFGLSRGHLTGRSVSMAAFAARLSDPAFQLGRPVLDLTGLGGIYDFMLDWTQDSNQPEGKAGPSIFTALQEQLGLKLDSQKGPVEVMVVDHVEKLLAEN